MYNKEKFIKNFVTQFLATRTALNYEDANFRSIEIQYEVEDAEFLAQQAYKELERKSEYMKDEESLCPYCGKEMYSEDGPDPLHLCDPKKATPTGNHMCRVCGAKVIFGTFCCKCHAPNGL